jgi:hypothetical protein
MLRPLIDPELQELPEVGERRRLASPDRPPTPP